MTEPEWVDELDKYKISQPFAGSLKAIKIREDEIDDELLDICIENYIISKVEKGYFITHEDIEQHLEIIEEHGMETYLEKRLEVLDE